MDGWVGGWARRVVTEWMPVFLFTGSDTSSFRRLLTWLKIRFTSQVTLLTEPLHRPPLSNQVRSPKRLQFKTERGTVYLPSFTTEDIETPTSIMIMGQSIDLTPFSSILQPVTQGLTELISEVGQSKYSSTGTDTHTHTHCRGHHALHHDHGTIHCPDSIRADCLARHSVCQR